MHLTLQEIIESITHLFYPSACVGCDSSSPIKDHIFCVECLMDLPETDLFDSKDNDMEYRLVGRVAIQSASALYYFSKGSKIQEAMHTLKYRRDKRIATQFGRTFARRWIDSHRLLLPDLVIPVPLHQKRQYQRGYNQSKIFGQSICEIMDVPFLDILIKTTHTESQTHKTRQERVSRLHGTIDITQNIDLSDKHILLVDDVLTTGATIEVCAKALLDYDPTIRISVGMMVLAENI